jgi:predicted nucleic acid-binding protein
MSYLLDTNVISELVKQIPTQSVVNWVDAIDNSELYISVITLGEIRKGVAGIKNIERQEKIFHWLEFALPAYFEQRILNIDAKVADMWGRLQRKNKGHILPAIDGLIAATAHVHGLKLVTRNTKDFINSSIELINPWEY